MSSSGAIPKVKGGARPKIKVTGNGEHKKKTMESFVPNAAANITSKKHNLTTVSQSEKRDCLSNTFNYESLGASFSDISVGNFKPLEAKELLIADEGVQIKRNALSPDWVEKRIFMHYTRPPTRNSEGDYVIGAVDAWLERMEFLVGDLSWLLNLPHHRFWSQVVYDRLLQESLQFYLMLGPRWYDPLPEDESCLSVINTIHRLTFLVYLRMSTYKESKEDHITPSVFGDLIYNHFLYDICKILDLCILHGISNRSLLQKIIHNVFTYQPKYFHDLSELTLSLFSVLKNLEEKLGVMDPEIPSCLSEPQSPLNRGEIKDVLRYMLDSFYSLHSFLSVFPKACDTFHEKEFEIRLSSFYERIVPKLTELLSPDEAATEEESQSTQDLQEMFSSVRMTILSVFNEILNHICLTKEEDKEAAKSSLCRRIESFTHILTSVLEEKIFVTDYSATFDLEKDILLFKEEGADLTTVNFVKEAVDTIVEEMASEAQEALPEEPKQADEVGGDDTSGMNGYYAGKTCSLSPIEVESLVSVVQDLIPELGSGFIKECLKYYNYSSEEVLNAILEDNLPPCLNTLDRTMKKPLESTPVISRGGDWTPENLPNTNGEEDLLEESGVLVSRLNIYDDDEFDVFRKPTTYVKQKKIYKGKENKMQYAKDAEVTEKVKNIIHQYEWNQGYSIYDDEEKYSSIVPLADYDDEYDDTYADDEAGNIDTFADDFRRVDRVPTIFGRGALNTPALNFDDEEGEEEDGGVEKGGRNGAEGGSGNVRRDATVASNEAGDRKTGKFKRANVSQRRGYADENQDWNFTSTMSFTNSGRGARRGRNTNSYRNSDPGGSGVDSGGGEDPPRPSFEPFCENPEETRLRMERNRQNKQFRNKGFAQYSNSTTNDFSSNNSSAPASSYQRTATKTNKHSGKTWRQGPTGGDDEGRKYQGGKYKEDTNHGQKQDRNYRHKMTHKNEQKRNAAQAKYRNNF